MTERLELDLVWELRRRRLYLGGLKSEAWSGFLSGFDILHVK